MEITDQASEVRSGEELNIARVESFLRDTIPSLDGKMTLRQFPGGHSNLTYLVTFKNREMVLCRPPFGTKAKTAHDMNREYRILHALKPVYPYCPEPLAYSEVKWTPMSRQKRVEFKMVTDQSAVEWRCPDF